MNVMEIIGKAKIVPVIKIDDVKDALPLAKALIAGGLPIAEVTFRTDAAEEAIRIMAQEKDMLVGAGTLTNVEQTIRAIDAGAKFLVSAGFNEDIVKLAKKKNIPIFPGACTPTEIMKLMEYDLPVVKFFPAKQYGGLDTIKALSGPFPSMKFMPTGGVGPDNINEYLSFPKIVACGGSWMVSSDMVNEGRFEEITQLVKEAVELVK